MQLPYNKLSTSIMCGHKVRPIDSLVSLVGNAVIMSDARHTMDEQIQEKKRLMGLTGMGKCDGETPESWLGSCYLTIE